MRNTIRTACWNSNLKPRLVIDFRSVANVAALSTLQAFFNATEAHEVLTIEEFEGCCVNHARTSPDERPWIVVSDNPCPEFLEDYWDRGASAIMRTGDLMRFEHVIESLRDMRRYRQLAPYDRLLTRSERDVLLAEVRGFSSGEIAALLGKSPRMVRDHTATLRDKLRARYPSWNLRKTQHLVHYYHGHWALLNTVAHERLHLPGVTSDQA